MPTLILKDHRKSFRSWLDQGILNRRCFSERDKTGRQYEKSRTVSKDPSDPDLALREILAIVKDLKKIPSILRSWLATDMKTTEKEKKDSLNTSKNPEVSNGILPILKDLKKKSHGPCDPDWELKWKYLKRISNKECVKQKLNNAAGFCRILTILIVKQRILAHMQIREKPECNVPKSTAAFNRNKCCAGSH